MPEPDMLRTNTTVVDGKTKEVELLVHFRPIGTRLCIKPINGEETTKSGIVIPDGTGGEKPQEGIIVAIGDELDTSKKKIAIGQKVLFSRYAGDEIRIRDEQGREIEFKILHYESLLGVVESRHDKPKKTSTISKTEVRSYEAGNHGESSGTELKQGSEETVDPDTVSEPPLEDQGKTPSKPAKSKSSGHRGTQSRSKSRR